MDEVMTWDFVGDVGSVVASCPKDWMKFADNNVTRNSAGLRLEIFFKEWLNHNQQLTKLFYPVVGTLLVQPFPNARANLHSLSRVFVLSNCLYLFVRNDTMVTLTTQTNVFF